MYKVFFFSTFYTLEKEFIKTGDLLGIQTWCSGISSVLENRLRSNETSISPDRPSTISSRRLEYL